MAWLVHVGSFQPFGSRVGIDTVVKLEFAYDARLVALLKGAIRQARPSTRKNAGGWLAEHRAWFVERDVWPTVRALLEEEGVCLRGDVGAATGPRRRPHQAEQTPTVPWGDLVRGWYRQLCLDFHPDRGGTTAAMQAINEAHSRLRRELAERGVDV
jgi:hypothetical protein